MGLGRKGRIPVHRAGHSAMNKSKPGGIIKYAALSITMIRIAGSVLLLFVRPMSFAFFSLYAICCLSDILDGYVARKTNTASKFGETLDSIADFIFIAVMLIIFLGILTLKTWIVIWIAAVALIRFVSLGVGFAKYRKMAFLHTYANKAAGIACACFPVLYQIFGLNVTAFILCGIASLSALEELTVSITSKELDRNVKGLKIFYERH
jgi:CDP-diacylglycerol--glycerol-3-phosphate 3-phosphatidyltransferase